MDFHRTKSQSLASSSVPSRGESNEQGRENAVDEDHNKEIKNIDEEGDREGSREEASGDYGILRRENAVDEDHNKETKNIDKEGDREGSREEANGDYGILPIEGMEKEFSDMIQPERVLQTLGVTLTTVELTDSKIMTEAIIHITEDRTESVILLGGKKWKRRAILQNKEEKVYEHDSLVGSKRKEYEGDPSLQVTKSGRRKIDEIGNSINEKVLIILIAEAAVQTHRDQ